MPDLQIKDGKVVYLDDSSPANTIYKLPTADGTTAQVIKTDGGGNLSFGDVSGTISISGSYGNSIIVNSDEDGGVSSDILHTDVANSRVGINDTTPSYTLDVNGTFRTTGNSILGDASGDSVTINAATIALANVAAGTDNTVLVYNGSSVVTDEIDSRVWGSTLVDGSGSSNNITKWSDSNTVTNSLITDDGSTVTVGGNFTVTGTTTTVNTTNTTITDNLLELNSGASSNSNDSGIIIERGSTGDNGLFIWDESADKFALGTTTGTASSTGDITYADAGLQLSTLNISDDLVFGNRTTTDGHIQLYNGSLSTGYAIGVEPSTTYYRSGSLHRWYIATLADGGTSDYMQLSTTALTVNAGLNVSGDAAFDTDTLFVDVSADRVGIGTTSPSSLIHASLSGDANNGGFEVDVPSSNRTLKITTGDTMQIDAYNSNSTGVKRDISILPSGGNVGIGTTAPMGVFHAHNGGTQPTAFSGLSGVFSKTTGGATQVSLYSTNTTVCDLLFSDPDDVDVGRIRYDHSSDSMSMVTNAATRMTIDSSGQVGIGTASPDEKLHVSGNIMLDNNTALLSKRVAGDTLNLIGINNSGQGSIEIGEASTVPDGMFIYTPTDAGQGVTFHNGTDPLMFIENDGNVGIGTTSPSYKLDINDDESTGAGLRVLGGGGGATLARFERDVGASGMFVDINCSSGDPQIRFTEASGVDWSIGVESDVFEIVDGNSLTGSSKFEINSSGDVTATGDIVAQGGVGTFGISDTTQGLINIYGGATGGEGGEIRIFNNADDDSTYDYWRVDSDGAGQFRIGRAGTTDLTVNQSGNFGIGTTSAGDKLEVGGDITLDASNANIKLKAGAGGTTGALYYTFNSDSTIYGRLDLPYDTRGSIGLRMKSASSYPITIDSGNGILFQEDGTTHSAFDNAGNLGIGTDDPSDALHVVGVGKITTAVLTPLVKSGSASGNVVLQGGNSGGANIELYGESHATAANDAYYDADVHNFRSASAATAYATFAAAEIDFTRTLNMNNYPITGVNSLTIKDPGPNEGLIFGGGSGWSIYESPDDLTTNSGGNLQFVDSGVRIFTLNTSGNGDFTGDLNVDGDVYAGGTTGTLYYNIISEGTAAQTRDKIRLWTGAPYNIGFKSGYSFGGLGGTSTPDYAMSFQMSNSTNRGWWWGDSSHSDAQGAMSLTTQGKASIAHSLNLGYGESSTTVPGSSYTLDVDGTGRFVDALTLDSHLAHNRTGAGSFPGYSAGTFGAFLEDGGSNGSSLYMARKNQWSLYLATDTTLNVQSDTVVQFADLNGQSGDQDNVVGTIRITSSSTAYNTSSDYRLKENEVDITDGIDRLKQLKPYRFNFKRDADTTVDGFFAHEVSDVVPEAITGTKDAMKDQEYEVSPAVYEDVIHPAVEATYDEDGNELTPAVEEWTESVLVTEAVRGTRSVPDYQGIDQSKLVPLLTAALQEAITKIEENASEIATLKAQVAALTSDSPE